MTKKILWMLLLTGMLVLLNLSGCSNSQPGNPAAVSQSTTTPVNQPAMSFPAGVPVLMYHSIGEEMGNDAVISPTLFAEQMAYLHSQGYNPVTMDQLYDYLTSQKGLPSKPVLITFDDGYRDTYEIALPILKRYEFKSTLFVLTSDSERRLTWQELQEMKASGMEIASHSYAHRNLAGMTVAAQADEITRSKELLDRNLKQDTRYFCYPNSSFSTETKRILQEKGFKLAVTIDPGWVKVGDDRFALRRVWIGNGVDINRFKERLTRADYPII